VLKVLDRQICSELLKNSKNSDRELARKLGVSQPTITRRRAKLERTRVIKEYTFIPDFPKLGYHILAITFLKYSPDIDMKQIQEIRKKAQVLVKDAPMEMVMAERGIGLDYDGMVMSYHTDYNEFVKFRDVIRGMAPTKVQKLDSFVINLDDEARYQPLTFSTFAEHLLTRPEK
jgi:DNA-binding Lrp family transcriptional regulator